MPRVVALAGGVGGAKLAHGLAAVLAPGDLSVVVNTADDQEFHGLLVCPDHDTVLYTWPGSPTASGLGPRRRDVGVGGAGRRVTDWFALGDRDLALHVHRTRRLREGVRLTTVSLDVQRALGVPPPIPPMADEPGGPASGRRTLAALPGVLRPPPPGPDVWRSSSTASGGPADAEVSAAIESARAIVICPSKPFVSVAPILAVPGMRALLEAARGRGVRMAAVSPLVGGRALRGPADRMAVTLGGEASATGIARHYGGLVDALLVDDADAAEAPAIAALGIEPVILPTVMTDDASRAILAAAAIAAALGRAP